MPLLLQVLRFRIQACPFVAEVDKCQMALRAGTALGARSQPHHRLDVPVGAPWQVEPKV
jgi:hypothetical protein